jgi:hypothetical protein
MAETQEPAKTEPTTNPESNSDDSEKKFWDEFDKRVKGHLNQFFEDKKAELTRPSAGRNGRTSLPGALANIMFGPEKKD